MPSITASIEVNRPADEVFAYATDPTRFHEWQKGVIDGRMDDHGTASVGTRSVTTRQIGLARRPVTAEVTHIGPPKSWGVQGIDGPIRAVGLTPLAHAVPEGLTYVPLADMPPSQLVIAWNTTNGNPLVRSFTQIAASAYRSAARPKLRP